MVNVNFNLEDEQLHINLATLPQECNAVVLNLPDGNHLVHQFNDLLRLDQPNRLDNLSKIISDFVSYLEFNEERKPNTLKGYRNRLGQFSAWLAVNKVRDPTDPSTWEAYYFTLKQRGLSDYTRKGHYHILNRFGAWLVKNGYLRIHPLADIRPPDLPKERLPKAVFQEHIRAMLTVADNPRDRAILLFFRDTGCRATEALSLTWSDVYLDEGKARLRETKNRKQRWLYFKPVTVQALRIYRETVRHKKSDRVWWGKKGSLGYDGLYKMFLRLAQKVDIADENFSPHAWRHAFGRDTTKTGIPTAQLQDLLGHSTIEVTKIYAQFDDSELQEAHDRYSPVDDDWDISPSSDPQDSDENDTE